MKCTKVHVEFGVYIEQDEYGNVEPYITSTKTVSPKEAVEILLGVIEDELVKDGYFPDGDFSTYEYWLTDGPHEVCAEAYVHFEPVEEKEES